MFAAGPGGEHTMTIAGEGRAPGRSHLLSLAEGAEVSRREAEAVIEEVRAAVANWSGHAKVAGVAAATAGRIARALPRLA